MGSDSCFVMIVDGYGAHQVSISILPPISGRNAQHWPVRIRWKTPKRWPTYPPKHKGLTHRWANPLILIMVPKPGLEPGRLVIPFQSGPWLCDIWSASYLNGDLHLKCVILGEILNTRLQEGSAGNICPGLHESSPHHFSISRRFTHERIAKKSGVTMPRFYIPIGFSHPFGLL